MSVPVTVNVHLTHADSAGSIRAESISDFAVVRLGPDAALLLRDLAVVDALAVAVAEARALLDWRL